MPSASDMGGSWKTLPIIVYVVWVFRLIMPWSVRMEEWPLFATMKFVTGQLIGWMKSVLRQRKNRNCNLYLVGTSFLEHQTSKKKPGWKSWQKAFGVDSKAHFLTWGYFTRTRQAIVTQALLLYTEDKNKQRRENTYGDRIRKVVHASFTPLVLSTTGGLSEETTIAYRRLAELLATKRGTEYGTTLAWMRCTLSFALLRSAISYIRGSRASSHRTLNTNIELSKAESRLLYSWIFIFNYHLSTFITFLSTFIIIIIIIIIMQCIVF